MARSRCIDKATGIIFHRVALLEDVGDVGDEYNYSPPASGPAASPAPTRASLGITRMAAGPLRAAFRVELELPLPAAAASAIAAAVRPKSVTVPVTIDATLDAGSPRVAFAVTVDNRASDHRLRMLFPTGAARVDTARADTAFDVDHPSGARRRCRRQIRNESPVSSLPMISVVDAGDVGPARR